MTDHANKAEPVVQVVKVCRHGTAQVLCHECTRAASPRPDSPPAQDRGTSWPYHDADSPPATGGDGGEREAVAERDAARKIVRDIYWMARRYADGRRSYAVGMFNDAVRPAYDAGWLEHKLSDEPPFARDGDFDAEYRTIEQRALDAETSLAALLAPASGEKRLRDTRELLERSFRLLGSVIRLMSDDLALLTHHMTPTDVSRFYEVSNGAKALLIDLGRARDLEL